MNWWRYGATVRKTAICVSFQGDGCALLGEKCPWWLKVAVKLCLQVRQKSRRSKSLCRQELSSNFRTTAQLVVCHEFSHLLWQVPPFEAQWRNPAHAPIPVLPPLIYAYPCEHLLSMHDLASPLLEQNNAVVVCPGGMWQQILRCPGEQAGFQMRFYSPCTPTSICVITARYKGIHSVTPWCLEQSRAKWPLDTFIVSEEYDWHLSWTAQHCSNVMSLGLHLRCVVHTRKNN